MPKGQKKVWEKPAKTSIDLANEIHKDLGIPKYVALDIVQILKKTMNRWLHDLEVGERVVLTDLGTFFIKPGLDMSRVMKDGKNGLGITMKPKADRRIFFKASRKITHNEKYGKDHRNRH